MRLRHIELFYYIMMTGSLRQASEALHVSQPAASKALRYAEQSLGFALFDRIGGRLVPTREARIMIPRVNGIFEQLGGLSRLTENLRKGHGGHDLSLGCVPSLGLSVVPRVISRYREESADNTLTVDTLHGGEIISQLIKRDMDFGIVFGTPDEPGLTCEHLADIPLVLLDTCSYTSSPVALSEIDPARWIGLAENDPTAWALSTAWKRAGWEISPAIRARTHYMAAELARLGAGWTIVDAFTALHDPTLKPRSFVPAMSIKCSAIFREDQALKKIARVLVRILREEFEREMALLAST